LETQHNWQSPHSLDAPVVNLVEGGGAGAVTLNSPPMQFSGEILVFLNTEGRLVSLRAIPPQGTASSGNTALTRDWTGLFAEAGMDPSQWSRTTLNGTRGRLPTAEPPGKAPIRSEPAPG